MIVGTSAAAGILALWTVVARRHWFVRVAIIIALLSMLAIVPAYDLVIVFLTQSACIVVASAAWRLGRSWHDGTLAISSMGRWRYRLADLLLLTAVVAVAVLLAKKVPSAVRESITTYLVWGAATGCAALIGWFAASCPRRWWQRVLVLLALPPIAAILPANPSLLSEDLAAAGAFLTEWGSPEWIWYPALVMLALAVAIWISLFRKAELTGVRLAAPFKPVQSDLAAAKHGRVVTARTALATLSLALVTLPAIAFYDIMTPPPIPVADLPSPNAYVELRRIGDELIQRDPPDAHTADESTLRTFVADNQERFDAVRAALAHESMVPVDYGADFNFAETASSIRGLRRALFVECRVAELDGRYDDACGHYLTLIHVGAKCSRGGLLIDWLVGTLSADSGLRGIQAVRARLSPLEMRKACHALRVLEAAFEPTEQIVRRDRTWEECLSWPARIAFLQPDADTKQYDGLQLYLSAQFRLLQCDLAIRLFHIEREQLPEALDELVPDYFASLSADPYTGEPFIYRRRHDDFVLYSTGPDQTDNGGVSTTTTKVIPPGEDLPLAAPSGS